MLEKLNEIKVQAQQELQKAKTVLDLGALKVKYLGKKGALTAVLRGMGSLTPEERPKVGQVANEIREVIEGILEERKDQLKEGELNESLKKETIDITLPGQNILSGHKHPITMVIDQMKDIFLGMGYSIGEGPEIELDYYNFEALNLPPIIRLGICKIPFIFLMRFYCVLTHHRCRCGSWNKLFLEFL